MSIFGKDRVEELISQEEISKKVKELGESIKAHYEGMKEPLVLVGVLKGSIIFLADLCRAIDMPVELDMMGVSSYGEATQSSGEVRITQDLTRPIKDKHVLIVEDIFDTGLTVKYLIENLKAREPASVKVCTLLKKENHKQLSCELDFVGFVIPDKFVVGYGLDVAERLRNLPMIGVFYPPSSSL
ncbi:MAG: hypoxanthine phosphoribosyltransferase [Myxococcales bacterium]|nr:hypoxanthine phosphoribosyltransferase [Myxococcales bacterium]USN51477.1 MAG: hypoxanthine phosphoribosyltransferase [Myxococcales bacterium]